MKFKLKKVQDQNDITIANISTANVRSEHIMNLTDYSTHYPDNNISILREISSTIEIDGINGGLKLSKYNIFDSVLITNEYSYSLELGTKIPLYYSHRINNNIYTKNISRKSIRKKITSDLKSNKKIKDLIPRNGKYILAKDSIDVFLVEENNTLTPIPFFVDYGNGELILDTNISIDDIYLITYLLVEDKFSVITNQGVISRISLEKSYKDSDNYFRMNILSTSQSPIFIKYISAESNGIAREYDDYTMGEPIYNEVPETIRKSIIDNNFVDITVFSRMILHLDGALWKEFIMIPFGSIYDTFTFKSDNRSSSIVKLKQIANKDYNYQWQIEATTGNFLHDGVVYNIPESKTKTRKIKDEPIKVHKYLLALTRENPILSINEDGQPSGIKITRGINENISIVKVDIEKGLVYLNEPVQPKDKITAEYYIKNNSIEYNKISFNPLSDNVNISKDMSQYIIILVMISNLLDDKGISNPIYHLTLPKYSKEGINNYTYDEINELVNGEHNIRDQIIGLPITPEDDHQLVILGSVYLSNCLDEDGYLVEDARVYGGGILETHNGYFDISFYDGEKTDISTILHIFIKQNIYNNLYDRILKYDRETRRYQNDISKMEKIAHKRTMEIINQKIEKFVPSGTEWEVVIG